ncbi:MAG: prepilin peptidase [Firmicutes bacterium]|nr:prepilin peptidase [Bacillota bacterium]
MDPEQLFFYIFCGLLGLLLGSFFNVVIYRYQAGVSIIRPRSYCPHCKHTLQALDLVPVFSYLVLRGRCRYCRAAIPFRYAAVELLSAFLLLGTFHHFGCTVELLKYGPVLFVLLIVSFIDLDIQKIPNLFVGMIFLWALLWQLLNPVLSWTEALLGFLAGGGVTLIIALVTRGGMGGGDIKLLAALGFLAGWFQLILIFFIAVFLGAIVGLIVIAVQRKGGKTPIPFGPFIAAGYAIVLFWGDQIWAFYLNTFIK